MAEFILTTFARDKNNGVSPLRFDDSLLLFYPPLRDAFDLLREPFLASPRQFEMNLRLRGFSAVRFKWQVLQESAGIAEILYSIPRDDGSNQEIDSYVLILSGVHHDQDAAAVVAARKYFVDRGSEWADSLFNQLAMMPFRPLLVNVHDHDIVYGTPASGEIPQAIGLIFLMWLKMSQNSKPPPISRK